MRKLTDALGKALTPGCEPDQEDRHLVAEAREFIADLEQLMAPPSPIVQPEPLKLVTPDGNPS